MQQPSVIDQLRYLESTFSADPDYEDFLKKYKSYNSDILMHEESFKFYLLESWQKLNKIDRKIWEDRYPNAMYFNLATLSSLGYEIFCPIIIGTAEKKDKLFEKRTDNIIVCSRYFINANINQLVVHFYDHWKIDVIGQILNVWKNLGWQVSIDTFGPKNITRLCKTNFILTYA